LQIVRLVSAPASIHLLDACSVVMSRVQQHGRMSRAVSGRAGSRSPAELRLRVVTVESAAIGEIGARLGFLADVLEDRQALVAGEDVLDAGCTVAS